MGRTFLRQETQIRNSDTYTDTVAAGQATLETAAAHIEDDLNALRSQVARVLDVTPGNWYDDVATVNTKKRGLSQLNTDLDDIEEKRVLCPVLKTDNVTVPASVQASGTIVAVAAANIADTETFTLDDGANTATVFEFDVPPDGVTGGNIVVDISGATTAIDVATAMVAAINGVGVTLELTADNVGGTSATVTITHDGGGTHGNVTTWADTVSDAGFVVTQPTGGAGDVVVLVQASSQTPTDVAAVDGGTALGALVATLAGDVGAHDLAEISATHTSTPKNRVLIRDAALHEGITCSCGRQVYGLLQAENGTANGDAFNDTDKQVQISFVVIDDNDDLIPAKAEDIGGKVIEYIYAKRLTIDTLPEDCTFPFFPFTDGSASVSVTLNNAIDNQGVTPSTQDTNIDIDMTTASVEWCWRDAASADLLCIKEGSAGGTSEIALGTDVDVFNVDAASNTFAEGATFDDTGTAVNVGVTAGQIDSAAALTVKSGGAADLTLQGANEIAFLDTNKGGSTYTGTFLLSDTATEWDNFELRFGEVSLLNALVQAYDAVGNVTKVYSNVIGPGTIAADTDVSGPANDNNLDTDLGNLSTGTFLVDYDVYVNGDLQRPGASAAANHDYYPGTSLANGQLKFEFKLKQNDVITVVARQ